MAQPAQALVAEAAQAGHHARRAQAHLDHAGLAGQANLDQRVVQPGTASEITKRFFKFFSNNTKKILSELCVSEMFAK